MSLRSIALRAALVLSCLGPSRLDARSIEIDLSGYHPECGIAIERDGDSLVAQWPMQEGERGRLRLNLHEGTPLFSALGIVSQGRFRPILENADPTAFLLVGSRKAPGGRPPGMSVFNVFFDSPADRPFQTHEARLTLKHAHVTSQGARATIEIGSIVVGSFEGKLRIMLYRGTNLIHVETVVHTSEDGRAILYDAGLALPDHAKGRFAWSDVEGRLCDQLLDPSASDRSIAVRGRDLALETDGGTIVCLPPPHQFFFPRDLTTNLKTVWLGRGHRGLDSRFGFGVCQAERGGGAFSPWFNAPPGTEQKLGVFYWLSPGKAATALEQTSRLTHGDRYVKLDGYRTFTTHWHLAATMAAAAEKAQGKPPSTPEFVSLFKNMGVEIIHLAEFHGDGHSQDPGPLRLAEMTGMFDLCRRLSDPGILFLPGEEANFGLGKFRSGREAGHWVYLFPKPVYWTMKRAKDQPFVADDPKLGRVYHAGDGDDMLRILHDEHGLAWTSHARVKGSSWTPDIYHDAPFFHGENWLGAAWKALPADLSSDRLGRRALDLMDDMANWGDRKYLPGEVDVFKIDHTHELYGHMNINYIALDPDRIPRFDDGWASVVDALGHGRFFVSTGEVLIDRFDLAGVKSGGEAQFKPGQELTVSLRWTFPMRFLEVVSGDGKKIYRERIELADPEAFGARVITLKPNLSGRKWVRVEAWDVAADGAFSQPIWLGRRVLRID